MNTNNILKLLALLACSFIYAACEEELGGQDGPGPDQTVVPNFPELIENYAVEPGSTQEIVFTPNLDWKLTLPSEIRQWFWIQDDSFKVAELTGKASTEPVTVKIGVTETAEFDKNFSCDVTLEMGDSSKVVAKYMLPAKEKTMQVYAAKLAEDGAFMLAEDGVSYIYSEEPSTAFDLVWSAADCEFRLPVKVVSNCEWTVDIPQWAEVNVPETTTGVVELVLKGESNEGATGKVAFYNGETKLVEVEASVPACGGIEVYSAKFENGEFAFSDDGEYAWSDKAVENITLQWLGSDFRVPVKVSAKCSWTIVMPDWLTVELPEKTAGEVSLTFCGVSSKYPFEDTSSKILFKNGNTIISELTVSIPGCRDIMSYGLDMALTELVFNHLGALKTTTGYVDQAATGHVKGAKQVRMLAVETTGNTVGVMNPDWFKMEIAAWNTADGADVLQERSVSFSVEENKGDSRSAVLFILPPSVGVSYTKLFNEDATVKAEYARWAINVSQASEADMEYIQVDESGDSEYECTFEHATEEKAADLTAVFGNTEYVYVLTYESPYSRDNAYMSMLTEFASYKVFTMDDPTTDKSADADFWLKFSNGVVEGKSGMVDMYADMDLPTKQSVGYVVFYGQNQEVLAIVECCSPFVEEILTLDVSSLALLPSAGTETINITSNVAWTATSNADWCVIAPASGSKDGKITVTVTENDTNQDRIAEITVKSENITHIVTVKQEFGEVFEVDSELFAFDFFGGTAKIKITSNVSWTVESNKTWCVPSQTSGEGSCELVLTINENRSVSAREAEVTLKSSTVVKTIKVTQNKDDGTVTNGDELVHFADWVSARSKGAILQRITSGEIYDEYKNGEIPVYHLTYTQENRPVRIVLPSTIQTHNVNPYSLQTNIRVNNTIYSEYFGPNDILSEVVLDDKNSVEVIMELPEGKDFLRGNINFIEVGGSSPMVIVVCTLAPSAN